MAVGVFSSLIWKFLNGGTAQIIQLVVSIVVARLLAPSDFGVVALLLVFTSIATVFVQSGLGTALVQKKEISQLELSSVFYYTFSVASILYVLLYLLAPYIEDFYDAEGIANYLRILALVLFPGSYNTIQNALLARRMLWKAQCVCNIISIFLSGSLGILLAFNGTGAWAIILQQLSYQIFVCVTLLFIVKWKPSLMFSIRQALPLFKYGFNLLVANIVDTVYHNLENLIIGKKYASEVLAFFTKGKMFPLVITNNVDGALQSVMLPVLSSKQESKLELKVILRKSIATSTMVLFGGLTVLALCADSLIKILLGENWSEAVPFLQWYCLIGMMSPLQTSSAQAINALGLSNIYLRIMSFKRVIGLILLTSFTLIFESVYAIVIAAFIVSVISVFIHMWYNSKLFGYTLYEQGCDVIKNIIGTIVTLLVYILIKSLFEFNLYFSFLFIILLSFMTYLFTLFILKSNELKYIIERILNNLKIYKV
ncbi:lipopolysaccharide biosynthesis protein [Parabacteroides sp. ASD2025]|uniref:lipopolysaccharide biosynthesis protein n=1 Tax=Parabacteroides sp. ASD2025 TaxID=3415987 RepID=UPI003CF86B1E